LGVIGDIEASDSGDADRGCGGRTDEEVPSSQLALVNWHRRRLYRKTMYR
jgi:hypothetical protein